MAEIELHVSAEEFRKKLDLKDGRDGERGEKGDPGVDGISLEGPPGAAGAAGRDGNDGSPDSPTEVKNKLESLKGEERLTVNAIKGLDNFGANFLDQAKAFIPRSLAALYDVQVPTVTNGQVLTYNSSLQKWVASTNSADGMSIGGTVTGGTDGSVLFINPAGILAEDNANFFWDNVENQLAIGHNTPEGTVDIKTTDPALAGLIVRASAGQGGNLIEWVHENGSIVAYVDPNGIFNNGVIGTQTGVIALHGSTSGVVSLQVSAAAGTWDFVLPTNDGNSSQFLQTNGSGLTSWQTAATLSFTTIAVSGQSNVVADTATDTLTLVAGSGMTITTNATTDSITFVSTSSNAFGTIQPDFGNNAVADTPSDTVDFISTDETIVITGSNPDTINFDVNPLKVWRVEGNALDANTYFLGSTTDFDFAIKRNSLSHMLFDGGVTYHNPGALDIDLIIAGDTATNLLVVDAGTDTVQIGTTVLGQIMQFATTASVFNENSADMDFRMESNNNANMFVMDAGADTVLIGTNSDLASVLGVKINVATDVGYIIDGATSQSAAYIQLRDVSANVGYQWFSDFTEEIWPANRTLTATFGGGTNGLISVDSTITMNFASWGIGAFVFNPTIIAQLSSGLLSGFLFLNGADFKNHTSLVGGNVGIGGGFAHVPTYTADTNAFGVGLDVGLIVNAAYSVVNAGTLTVTNSVALERPAAFSVGAGVTVTALRGVWLQDVTNAGTITTNIGIDIESLTTGATNIAIRTGASGSVIFGADVSVGTVITPDANDGAAIGTTALQWSDIFLAEGGVINWDNGDATLTQTGNAVVLAGAAFSNSGQVVTGGNFTVDATTVPVEGMYRPTGAGNLGFAVSSTAELLLTATAFSPATSDGNALGTTALQWGDLFLAEGGVINWDNGDFTITQTGNLLAFTGGQMSFAQTVYFAAETDNGNSGTADTIDWTLNQKQKSTVTGNVTYTFTAPGGPCNLVFRLVHEASATAYTITWPATVKWPSGTKIANTNTSGAVDIVSMYFDGTNYNAVGAANFA